MNIWLKRLQSGGIEVLFFFFRVRILAIAKNWGKLNWRRNGTRARGNCHREKRTMYGKSGGVLAVKEKRETGRRCRCGLGTEERERGVAC